MNSSRSLGQSKSKKEESQSRSINLEQIDNMNNTGISNIDYFSLKYQPFKKHAFSNTSHKTTEIGELKHVDLGNYDRSTFSSVIAYLEVFFY